MNEIGHGLAELPQPLRFSRMLGELLSRVSTPLEPYDLIAGRVPDRELTSGEEALYQSALKDPDSPSKKVFLSSGHCTYSWASLVKLGLPGLKRRAEETLERVMREDPPGPLKDGKAVFLRGMTEQGFAGRDVPALAALCSTPEEALRALAERAVRIIRGDE